MRRQGARRLEKRLGRRDQVAEGQARVGDGADAGFVQGGAQVGGEALEAAAADGATEEAGDHVFEGVRLVDDDDVGVRQQPGAVEAFA